ncbi:hypothetical protein [Nocardioides sp. InS609-2]|uniref:hypothetical protein n=1 Tax=Nocardioides sp. InS609-2 TaxID=2760705 RepID=UPI0020BE927E|nr:hypothetical protein [Nocardioides sp. InS609-2]
MTDTVGAAHVKGMTATTTDPAPLTVDDLQEDDVLRWIPESRHTYEGAAVVHGREDGSLYAVDTFWGSGNGNHVLTPAEIATATVEWNINDFRPADARVETWSDFAPEDRRHLPSQHGLQATYWIRPGAQPDHGTMVAKAEDRFRDAQSKLTSAQAAVDWARKDLDRLRADGRKGDQPREDTC